MSRSSKPSEARQPRRTRFWAAQQFTAGQRLHEATLEVRSGPSARYFPEIVTRFNWSMCCRANHSKIRQALSSPSESLPFPPRGGLSFLLLPKGKSVRETVCYLWWRQFASSGFVKAIILWFGRMCAPAPDRMCSANVIRDRYVTLFVSLHPFRPNWLISRRMVEISHSSSRNFSPRSEFK